MAVDLRNVDPGRNPRSAQRRPSLADGQPGEPWSGPSSAKGKEPARGTRGCAPTDGPRASERSKQATRPSRKSDQFDQTLAAHVVFGVTITTAYHGFMQFMRVYGQHFLVVSGIRGAASRVRSLAARQGG